MIEKRKIFFHFILFCFILFYFILFYSCLRVLLRRHYIASLPPEKTEGDAAVGRGLRADFGPICPISLRGNVR